MFGWFKKRKAKAYCPKCKFKLTLSYDKDAVFEPYEYGGLPCPKLATTVCPSCNIEVVIIIDESRIIGDPKYLALDPEFEMEKEKYDRENAYGLIEIMEKYGEAMSNADDDQTRKKLTELDNQELEKHTEKYLDWEKRTKEKLGYKLD